MKNSKCFIFQSIGLVAILLILLGTVIVYIDPYFHYHEPLDKYQYPINNERYQNDGITRNFEYNAVIAGSSMTECFKTSEFDSLFNARAIKIPYSGGRYKEVDEAVKRALERNTSLEYVVRGLDFNYLVIDKDSKYYENYPDYLYDENLFNDVSYVFNKEVLFNDVLEVIDYTKRGELTTSFDDYSNWSDERQSGKAAILDIYIRPEMASGRVEFDDAAKEMLRLNLEQNVIQTIKENPDVKFYLFFPPYSIYWWDSQYRSGQIERHLEAEKYAIEMLIPYENVYLFSFFDAFDMICNADLYIDTGHYVESVNSQILQWMKSGEHRLTKDNYEEYCDKVAEFLLNYDYDKLF